MGEEQTTHYINIIHNDVELVNKLIKRLNQADISLDAFNNHNDFVASIKTKLPSVVVCKMISKNFNAIQIIQEMQNFPKDVRPAVIVIGPAKLAAKEIVFNAGASSYIEEPASYLKIQAVVQTWIRNIEEKKNDLAHQEQIAKLILSKTPELNREGDIYKLKQSTDEIDTEYKQATFKGERKDYSYLEGNTKYKETVAAGNLSSSDEKTKKRIDSFKKPSSPGEPEDKKSRLKSTPEKEAPVSESEPTRMWGTKAGTPEEPEKKLWSSKSAGKKTAKEEKRFYTWQKDESASVPQGEYRGKFWELKSLDVPNKPEPGEDEQSGPPKTANTSSQVSKESPFGPSRFPWQTSEAAPLDGKKETPILGPREPTQNKEKETADKKFPWQSSESTQNENVTGIEKRNTPLRESTEKPLEQKSSIFNRIKEEKNIAESQPKQQTGKFPWQKEGENNQKEKSTLFPWQRPLNEQNKEVDDEKEKQKIQKIQTAPDDSKESLPNPFVKASTYTDETPGLWNADQNKQFPWQKDGQPKPEEKGEKKFPWLKDGQQEGQGKSDFEGEKRFPWQKDGQTKPEEKGEKRFSWQSKNNAEGNPASEKEKKEYLSGAIAPDGQNNGESDTMLSGQTETDHYTTLWKVKHGGVPTSVEEKIISSESQADTDLSSDKMKPALKIQASGKIKISELKQKTKDKFGTLKEKVEKLKTTPPKEKKKHKKTDLKKPDPNVPGKFADGFLGGANTIESKLNAIEVTLLLGGSDDVMLSKKSKEILDNIFEKICSAMEGTNCSLLFLKNNKPHFFANRDFGLIETNNPDEIPGFNFVVKNQKPFFQKAASPNERSIMNVPIIVNKNTIGCFYARRIKTLDFSTEEAQSIKNIFKGLEGILKDFYSTL